MKYKMAWPFFPPEEIDWLLGEFRKILQGDSPLSMGGRVKEFEGIFANYINVDFAVGTNSCTAALEIALRSIDIKKGDEVLVPVETFIATGAAIVSEGGQPVFCDIDSNTYCLSLEEVKKRVTDKTRAIILVHMAGMVSPDALKIKEFCDQNDITLIEDAAHGLGSSIDGIKAGAIGHIGCFSFYPTKLITTAEGGMLVCSNKELFEKANSFRNRGRDMSAEGEVYSRLGTNNRMTEFSALLGISQMKLLNNFLDTRNSIANVYNKRLHEANISHLAEPIIVPDNIQNSYWRYLISLSSTINREVVKEQLSIDEIPADWAYYPPLHLQPYFIREFDTNRGMCPVAEDLLERNLCLPINPTMSIKDAEFVVGKFIQVIQEQQVKI